MRRLLAFGLAGSAVFIVSMSASFSADHAVSTMQRSHDPVQVPGSLLSELQGEDLDDLRLFALHGGVMEQIVYQFDERTEDGSFIMDMGEKKNPEDHNFSLDPQDFLMFRIGDSGDRAPSSAWPAKDGVEIELFDPVDGGRSWAYLLKFNPSPPARLDIDTVVLEHWDPWERPDLPFIVRGTSYRIEGMVNRINDRYYKTAVNKDFRVPPSAGGTDVNILDGQRMRAYVELKFGIYRVEADETSLIGGIDALRHGYVRGCGRQWMTQALPFGLEGPRIYSDVFTYDRIIVSPMQLNIPINPKMIMNEAGIEFGYDLNENARGMRFYSPNCMEGVTIDGKMSEIEKNIPDKWVPWYLITGPQGSLIFRVDIEEKFMEQTTNRLTYLDDTEHGFPPEDVPGSIGYAKTSIIMQSVKSGRYNFQIEWYFPPNFYRPGGYDEQMLQDFLNIKDNPVIISVDGMEARNDSLRPPPLVAK